VEEVLERLKAMEERLLSGGRRHLPFRPARRTPPIQRAVVSEEGEEPEEEAEEVSEAEPAAEQTGGEKIAVLSAETQESWREFISFAKKKKPPLLPARTRQPLTLDDNLLEVGYPEKSFYLDRMQEADNLNFLQNLSGNFQTKPESQSMQPASGGATRGPARRAKGRRRPPNGERGRSSEPSPGPEAINIFGDGGGSQESMRRR